MEKLHPSARWVFRFRAYSSLIFLTIVFFFIYGLLPFLLALIGVILIAEIYARMAYNRWFYELTPISLKLERGIIWKNYSNVPYERVQNVDITRGILARMLGFSTLHIQTAGYSAISSGRGGGFGIAEGYIPAVSVKAAEKIREFLMKKIGKKQGL